MKVFPVHAQLDGPLVMIGYGSIGRGVWPLIERHIGLDRAAVTVIEPKPEAGQDLAGLGLRHLHLGLTPQNYREVLAGLLPGRRGLILNLSVDVSSVALIEAAADLGVTYIDTVVEPWAGVYFDKDRPNSERTNYFLREEVLALARRLGPGPTAVSCCGANPGMVSWLVKEGLVKLAADLGHPAAPAARAEWGRLMRDLGVKGVHIAERDTQVSRRRKPPGVFVNTWSVEGFLSEGFQPSELGWGTHEKRMPAAGREHTHGTRCAIWLDRAGADTRVRTWVPGVGPQFGFLVTHNEAISIADYFTLGEGARPAYRPTCHYAYHPCNDAVLSLHETLGAGRLPAEMHILTEDEIVEGSDDLGVLLYGHAKGALWYGSRLSIEETRRLAPNQNATGLQVTAAVLAAMVWAIENQGAGVVEADEMDHARCMEVARPYLGRIEAHYTGWTPVDDRVTAFGDAPDRDDPWQFTNVLAD
jgi:homospermidine synthase